MKYAVVLAVGLLIGGAVGGSFRPAPIEAVSATPTPRVVYVTPSPAPLIPTAFDHRNFTVALISFPSENSQRMVAVLDDGLAAAWKYATRGRSTLRVVTNEYADAYAIVLGQSDPKMSGWQFDVGREPTVLLYYPSVPFSSYGVTHDAVHELGHVLGCCHGPGSDGAGHIACPTDAKPTPLMCGWEIGDAPTFNDYELAQMGL